MATKKEIKEGYVEIRPRRPEKNEDPNIFVGINGKTWLIPKGVSSVIPDYVAAEIERSEQAKDHFLEVRDQLIDAAK